VLFQVVRDSQVIHRSGGVLAASLLLVSSFLLCRNLNLYFGFSFLAFKLASRHLFSFFLSTVSLSIDHVVSAGIVRGLQARHAFYYMCKLYIISFGCVSLPFRFRSASELPSNAFKRSLDKHT